MNDKKKNNNDSSPLDTEQTASGRATPLLSSHKIVYRALRAANITFGRVVNSTEIINLLTDSEREELTAAYKTPFNVSARRAILLLVRRGIVFKLRKVGREWFYGATDIVDVKSAVVPVKLSRSVSVLKVVREAVIERKRALRLKEIWEYAAQTEFFSNYNEDTFRTDVGSLLYTGELKRVGTVCGDKKGSNLYLPSELDEELYKPTDVMSWLEEVSLAFDLVWQRHLTEAKAENRKPLAVSTGEVRVEWMKMPQACSKAFESQPVVDAMKTLGSGTRHQPAKLRRIKRSGERFLLWCPIEYTDEMLNSDAIYLSDFERIETAVKRAITLFGRPVTLSDVRDEIELDPALHLVSNSKIRKVLFDASKNNVGSDGKSRRYKFSQRIYHVGMLDNVTYYHHGETGLTKAYGYVETLIFKSDLEKADIELRLDHLNTLSAPEIVLGNAKLILSECATFAARLKSLSKRKMIEKSKMNKLRNLISTFEQKASHVVLSLSNEFPNLPDAVDTQIPGLTGDELVEVMLPTYPGLKPEKPGKKFSPLFWGKIRRFRNPDFTNRFSTDAQQAAEFLFDRTDTLMYIGSRWGGMECAFQARTAKNELGLLRDVGFVKPILKSKESRIRIIGICCLAFLSGEIGTEDLLELVRYDKEAGVRQSALWAYCFRNQDQAGTILKEVIENDPNVIVRQFASKCLSPDKRGWWGF